MAKEKSNNMIWIIAVIAIAVIFLGPKFGLFSSSELPVPENEDPTYQVVLSVLPTTVCTGDVTTGSISANIPNGVCKIYTKIGGLPYTLSDTITLNSQGVFSKSSVMPEAAGNIYAYTECCDSQNHCKNSNEAKIVINTCGQEQVQTQTCFDNDGGQDDQQFKKGTVNVGLQLFTDECDWGTGKLNEYYCDNGQAKMMQFTCENYWTCKEGKCAQQLCEDIMNPTMEKCAAGYTTDGGTCSFWNINNNPQCLSSFNND